jgi:cytochrome oxidase assembly protein ShyY1
MYGFLLRPKWIAFHLLVFGSIALMIWLGLWQLDRLDARRDFNEVVSERIEQAPVAFDELLTTTTPTTGAGADPSDLEWRPTVVAGSYLPEQILWFNRSQGGVAGDNVLSPFVTVDGTTVLVNRGFVQLGATPPPAPTGSVELLARVRTPQQRQLGELTDRADRSEPLTEVRRIDLDALAPQLPAPLAPVYLDLIDANPAPTSTDPAPLPPPTLDEGPHLSYAVQWFIFAACVLVGWLLAVRRSIRTRRRADGPSTDRTPVAAGVGDAVAVSGAAPAPAGAGSDRPVASGSTNSTPGTAAPSPH